MIETLDVVLHVQAVDRWSTLLKTLKRVNKAYHPASDVHGLLRLRFGETPEIQEYRRIVKYAIAN